MKPQYILVLLLLLTSCVGHEGDTIRNDDMKNSKLLVPPCLN